MLLKVDSAEDAGVEPCLMVKMHCWEAGISIATRLGFLPLPCGRFYRLHFSVGISATESTTSLWAFLPLLRGHFYHFSVDISTTSLLGIYTTFLWAFLPLLYQSMAISAASLWAFLPLLCGHFYLLCAGNCYQFVCQEFSPLTQCH